MHSWKKKLVVSQLALACTLAITSQANATTYDTWTYYDNPTTALDWNNMDAAGTVDGNYVNYSGFVYYNNANGDFDQTFNGDTVNGTISTYYLNHDYNDATSNELNISNSVIHGSITSMLPIGYYDRFDTLDHDGYSEYYRFNNGTDTVDGNWYDGDVFTLNIANSTIDDDYEAFYFTDSYKDGDVTKYTNETFDVSEGVAVNLDVESNINISNNSRVAGIALSQGNTYNNTYTTESHNWDNNINVFDSTVTSGSDYILDSAYTTDTGTFGSGHFGNSDEPSDYTGAGDVALSFTDDNGASDYAMKNNVYFSNSTLMGDVKFTSTWNLNFDEDGDDTNGDGVPDTNHGWADDGLNVDELNLTLDNGSKWVGQATYTVDTTSRMYDVETNSLTPGATLEDNAWNRIVGNEVFQSGVFNVTLNNGSEWDTVGTRLTNARHGLADNGGAWVSYFGGNFNGDNGTINYDQDVNGIMVGVDTKVDGNNAKWIVGAAAGFAKGDLSDRTGQVDQDSQSAYIYSSARFANNIFVDGNLSYSHFNNDLSANMSDGTYVDGNTSSDAWGFGLKLGYDLKLGDAGYVTPYGSVSGLFQSGDDYQLSNDMKVDGQSYDSMRYEIGVDAGYTFTYSEDQALTPYFKLAYVYDDSNNDADVNGDSIDNGVEGSAVRVGLGTQFSFTKNFSAYTDANYLGGGDVDQDWSANVGVKYTW
ncbi:TPA: autotransporter outer membrane beta-barrel domain-containing protein [Salmonella enterica subsp. enterica serovar Horsham]|nr:autotransporter outer membrane beta-barrel domain-containing protein [Salmonella enterica]EAS1876698.1 autotransporter outer membrane beta-barrel domain-containing protein [Salmonella enterica]EAX2437674.1 autotransporter outer membrane beta-barrel domain-containing protein [Salmonella enterica]EAY0394203.1 autotransporter outer membrane beta-barrel domain-containing protein [Salmonella enterica]EBA2080274.1 autotransporter outer membrane beta-barrel domain-containing protein [Salmonella ent